MTIAEALARAEYERKDWSGCEGSRWERLPELVRAKRIELKHDVAAVIDEALGGLTCEEVNKPECYETGVMLRNYHGGLNEPEMLPEKLLRFIPSFRWVSGWTAVKQ